MAHAPIDNTHSPFKRLAKLGPGPRDREPISVKGKYNCRKKKGKKYEQVCLYRGADGRIHKKTVKTKKKWKKAYNKEYAKFAAQRGLKPRVNAPRRGYKPKSPASGKLVTYRGTF